MDGIFISQWRSWDIMWRYFGIERPGTSFIPLKFPPPTEQVAEKLIQKAIKSEKKRIEMN